MQFTEARIQGIVKRMRQQRAQHDARLRVRRMFLEMAADAYVPGNGTGTNIPEPFDKSRLVFQVLVGEVSRGALQYTALTAANAPSVTVPPIAIDRPDVTQRVDRYAAEQERLLSTLWESAGGRQKQWQVSYSQSWGRVGWYFTLPRDRAWGMPDRAYFDDLSDDELEGLKASGRATPEPIQSPAGVDKYAEAGTAYLERRKRTAQQQAISARSLFVLDAYPPDVVYAAYDSDGVKWAAAVLEVPALDCGPGSDYAKMHHRQSGSTENIARYGLYTDSNGLIRGGVTTGGEAGANDGTTWTYTIFGTREEVYCLVSSSPDAVGTLVWYAEHDLGDCPFVPVPGYYTDSSRPGGEYSSPMEAVFAKAPILSQLETLLALVAGYNATARWVIIQKDGQVIDANTGDPVSVGTTAAIGGQPKQTEIVAGTPFLLTLDADLLYQLVQFYAAQLKLDLPSDAATGSEGTSGTAWGLRAMIEQSLTLLKQPVDNHAEAVRGVMRRWMHCMRSASERGELETVYAFALPSAKQRSARQVRGLIEFDPAHLIDSIVVKQSSDTAQSRIVKQAHGVELLGAGVVTMRGFLEDYMEEGDSRQAEIDLVAYDLQRFALYGDTNKLQPQSVLYDFAMALRGRLAMKMLEQPAFALATAESMATDAMAQFQASQQPTAGSIAEASGLKQPGVGMPVTPVGEPGGGQVPAVTGGPM